MPSDAASWEVLERNKGSFGAVLGQWLGSSEMSERHFKLAQIDRHEMESELSV